MTAVITLSDVTLGYDRHPAVHHLSGVIEQGSLTAIVGPNGAGKSTLLRALAGLLKPLDGKLSRNPTTRVAYLPQVNDIDRSFPINVFDFVAIGLDNENGAQNKIAAALASVGLTGFENRAISTLSGGQMQRMLFARVMMQDAQLILLDEPFSAIDTTTTGALATIVSQWHAENRTVLAAMHDLALVRSHFPQTLLLAREPVAWGATQSALTPENLAKANALCEAFDEHAALCVVQPHSDAA